MAKKFELEGVALLPPLTKEQVEGLLKFASLNAHRMAEMVDYEGCCWHDDIGEAQRYVYDSIRLGYGLVAPDDIHLGYDDEDEDEDDE